MIDQDIVILDKPKRLKNPTLELPTISIFAGGTNSGKTTSMMSFLIALQKAVKFQRAMFVSSNMIDPKLKRLSEEVKLTNDPDEVRSFFNGIKHETPDQKFKDFPSIVIFDDCQMSPVVSIRNNPLLDQMVISHRHYNTWFVFCVQTFRNSMSTAIRKMGSLFFVWPNRNELEWKAIQDELPVDKRRLQSAMTFVKEKEHTPLYINLQQPKARLYRGFREEIKNFD